MKWYIELLEKSLLETNEELTRLREQARPVSPDNAIGRVSRMDAINNKSIVDRTIRMAQMKKQRLENILKNKGKERLGRCFRCNQPIPEERLRIVPDSIFCLRCTPKNS